MSVRPIAAVTGASGLAGRALVDRLCRAGYHVRALARQPQAALSALPGVDLHLGDLGDSRVLAGLCAGAELVFNAAAHVSDWGEPAEFFEVNARGAERVFAAALQARVARLVHLSTVDVFGFRRHAIVSERTPRVAEPYAYSRSKLEGEELAWSYAARGLPLTVVYPTWIFGPSDRHFLPELLKSIERGEYVHVDDGAPHLELVFSENLADACLLVAKHPEALGQGFILGDAYGVSVREFVDVLCEIRGVHTPERRVPYGVAYGLARLLESFYAMFLPKRRPPLTSYAVRTLLNGARYDLSKLQALGYEPRVGLHEALVRSLGPVRSVHWGSLPSTEGAP